MAKIYYMRSACSAAAVAIQHRGLVSIVDVEGGKVEDISVIPLRSHDVVALQWQQKGTESARVDVFDAQGQLVLSAFNQANTASHFPSVPIRPEQHLGRLGISFDRRHLTTNKKGSQLRALFRVICGLD